MTVLDNLGRDSVRVVFLMDPLSQVEFSKDTTYQLMLACDELGYQTYYMAAGQITLDQGVPFCSCYHVRALSDPASFEVGDKTVLSGADIDVLFVRTEPPFSDRYLTDTWLLDLFPESCRVVNRPSGIRSVNEKVWVTQFTDLVPSTLVTADMHRIRAFIQIYNSVIIKPLNGFGGKGIFKVSLDDPNLGAILETVTKLGQQEVIVQDFISQASEGDKRILLQDGEILGAVLRHNSGPEHRNNLMAGGQASPVDITDRDREICKVIQPHLKALGLYFVGIDVIGSYLIEVNVTSPTCLQELNRFSSYRYDIQIMKDLVLSSSALSA